MLQAAVHLKVRDRVRVLDALAAHQAAQGLVRADDDPEAPEAARLVVCPPRGGWTTVAPEQGEAARALAAGLAQRLAAPALVVGLVDDGAVFYSAYDAQGEAKDDYHSCPDWERDVGDDDAGDDELARTRGDPDAVAALFGLAPGGDAAALAAALAGARIERLRDHDPASDRVAPAAALRAIERAFGLAPLPDAAELWGLGPAADDEVDDGDVVRLAWRRPPPPRKRPWSR